MNIILKEITLHHFLSFDEATINLQDKGFCLVSGINSCPKDAAKSNGAGKSTIWNAISFVLTGETLNGLKSNLGNIYFNDGCWVKLSFTIDNINYVLIRSKEDKRLGTNLKIEVNGLDKSGKGIRESEDILSEILPDITSELIGSVMILGQGMPSRFTNNTPSRRKEILEHLSKSDFMIQDLKDRVEKRLLMLNSSIGEKHNKLMSIESQIYVYDNQLEKCNQELNGLENPKIYEEKILKLESDLKSLSGKKILLSKEINDLTIFCNHNQEKSNNLRDEKQKELDKYRLIREQYLKETNEKFSLYREHIFSLKEEITRLESIKDICPTCGQKIPNVVKPDISKQKEELKEWMDKEYSLKEEKTFDDKEYSESIELVNEKYDSEILFLKEAFKEKSELLNSKTKDFNNLIIEESNINTELNKFKLLKDNYYINLNKIKSNISELDNLISGLQEDIKKENIKIKDLNSHLEVVSKMNTFLKRDFRGYLLENIINYISLKTKDYCNKIFGSDEIKFSLNGNNIDIEYCTKDYDNLSGGEKQRVDLIIQFAIRDMLVNYLGFNSNILVLDEITDNLDSLSCEKVLNFITEELSNIESVFIISHHSDELEIPSDSELIIHKNELGLSEVV